MPFNFKYKRGNFSSTSSLQSLTSSVDTSLKEDFLPHPSSLEECDDQLQTYQILLQGKKKRKTDLIENLKHLRSEKEPLLKVKLTLQEEISKSNQVINTKSEEVTQIKHKLRHHSERQIQDNIERLEIQLRNNNYKPKEEQKILDEIFVLKKSFKSLREFELKQRENKKYREDRSRLIQQRNEVFSKVQAIFLQEEEIKREISELRHIIHSSEKSIEHLNTLRPELEFAFAEVQRKKEEFKIKKQKEKVKIKREQSLIKLKERQKRWEEYEDSKEPYEEEKDSCKRLLAYLNAALPTTQAKKDNTETEAESCVSTQVSTPSTSGNFYSKPQYSALERTPSKKKKSREKRKEQKASKKRELSHPPDVLSNLTKFSFPIPKTTDDVPHCIKLVEQKLKYYNSLCKKDENLCPVERNNSSDKVNHANHLPCSDIKVEKCPLDSSKEKEQGQISQLVSPLNSVNETLPHINNSLDIVVANSNHKSNSNFISNVNSLNSGDCKFSPDPNCSTSYFSLTVPGVPDSHHKENSLGPTYASVAAGIKV